MSPALVVLPAASGSIPAWALLVNTGTFMARTLDKLSRKWESCVSALLSLSAALARLSSNELVVRRAPQRWHSG